jgi:serine protease Do
MIHAQQPVTGVANEVNKKLVKLYGAGGFKGLPSYGTGILVSPDGYILTVNNHILTTQDLRVRLADGRFYHHCKVVAREPELDVALIKIDDPTLTKLSYFSIQYAAAAPLAQNGDWIVAFSNQFNIASGNEPMSVQRGSIQAYTELRGRRGIFTAPFNGEVYFIDAIICNPGAAGGAVTTRRGDLIGIIGREIKNTLSDTWINYAIPVQAKAELIDEKDKVVTVTLADFVNKGIKGEYKLLTKRRPKEAADGYTGIVLVPNVVQVTPAYVEEVIPDSPAAKAGLRPDDQIVYIDGELVQSIKAYKEIVKYARPGTELVLEVQRGNRLATVRLKVAEHPKPTKAQ